MRASAYLKAHLIVVLLLGAALVPATEATRPVKSAESSAQPDEPAKDFSEKYQLHLATNAPLASAAQGVATNKESEGFHWDWSWQGWNGLQLGISHRTDLKTPREMLGFEPASSNAPTFHLEQLKMTTRLGALIEVDGAMYATKGNFDLSDDLGLRRGRLKAQGDCVLLLPVSYKIELGYIPHKFNLNEAWLASEHLDYIGYLKFGVFGPPMGLDMITSSRDLTFMEPATVLQALAPANEAGIQIGQPVFDQRMTWTLGIFGGGLVATEYGNASQDYGNLIGRLAGLALDHINTEDPGENRYLHLGLSANVQYSASSTVQYRSRPESYLAEHVIDTGKIDATGAGTLSAEAAYVNGPFSVQGEFLDSLVRQNNGDGLNFWGFYASASWYLTGESRPYDRANGDFKRLIPKRNFNFGKDGAWGAFQLGGRFSYTDLNSGDINGGKIGLLMAELNWYLHSHVRWMFNGGGGHVTGVKSDGNLVLFQTRIGVDF